jgi:hypothetical protein
MFCRNSAELASTKPDSSEGSTYFSGNGSVNQALAPLRGRRWKGKPLHKHELSGMLAQRAGL